VGRGHADSRVSHGQRGQRNLRPSARATGAVRPGRARNRLTAGVWGGPASRMYRCGGSLSHRTGRLVIERDLTPDDAMALDPAGESLAAQAGNPCDPPTSASTPPRHLGPVTFTGPVTVCPGSAGGLLLLQPLCINIFWYFLRVKVDLGTKRAWAAVVRLLAWRRSQTSAVIRDRRQGRRGALGRQTSTVGPALDPPRPLGRASGREGPRRGLAPARQVGDRQA
jgi:hypothetical protein